MAICKELQANPRNGSTFETALSEITVQFLYL
jgi:hypothetical protein